MSSDLISITDGTGDGTAIHIPAGHEVTLIVEPGGLVWLGEWRKSRRKHNGRWFRRYYLNGVARTIGVTVGKTSWGGGNLADRWWPESDGSVAPFSDNESPWVDRRLQHYATQDEAREAAEQWVRERARAAATGDGS